jgi:DNA mismatch repair protein MSH5
MLNLTVDRESSVNQHRTVINKGINQELDEIKAVYDSMQKLLIGKAREIQIQTPPELGLAINVTYIPHMGFHIAIPTDGATGQAVFDGQDLGWQLMFTTESQAYFKDETTNGLDYELGDLYSAMCEIEVEIAYDLAQRVLQDEKFLIAASDLCGELDCLLAFSQVAYHCKLTRPTITEENIIQIEGGRHLLQEMAVPSFVANDTYLVGGNGQEERDGPSMLLLTGPNYSGKSVYQKQVALAVYMAQIGSFVPADAATIGITDKILTRITTRETVSKVQSAFMIDMQQIAMALNSCTRRSLVVVDEFGKGTDTCDGAGLAAGVFHYLLSLGANSPKTLVATHFHEIFDLGLFEDVQNLSLAHMEVQVEARDEPTADEHNSEITYLYNLRPGRSGLSYGTQCAAMNGVPIRVVDRAVELARLAQEGEDLVAICSALTEDAKEELEHAQNSAQMFVDQDFDRDWTKDELALALDAMLQVAPVAKTRLSG